MPKKPGMCDPETNKLNRTAAKEARWEYYKVSGVKIDGSVGDSVTISVPVKGGERRTFPEPSDPELKWGDPQYMWIHCPSSLPSDAVYPETGRPPKKGATGALYLEKTFVETNHIVAEPTPKWPRGLDGWEPTETLSVLPVSLVLTGLELADDGRERSITIELMNRIHAPQQTIALGDGAVTISLTRDGFGHVNIPFPGGAHLAKAVEIIEDGTSAAAMARAYDVVAACDDRLRADRWPALDDKASGGLTAEVALALIRKVTSVI